MNNLRDRLNLLMEERGIKQQELAEIVGVTEVSMSRYVNGQRVPRPQVLMKISDALETTVDYLLGKGLEAKTCTLTEDEAYSVAELIDRCLINEIRNDVDWDSIQALMNILHAYEKMCKVSGFVGLTTDIREK